VASPSLGHYASLSFVVIGREQRAEGIRLRPTGYAATRRGEVGDQRAEDRNSLVGAAFSRDSNNFYAFNDMNRK